MAIMKFDKATKQFERPTLLLRTRSGELLGELHYTDFSASLVANGLDGISFNVHKTDNNKTITFHGENKSFWDKVEGLKVVEWVGYGFFEATITVQDELETIKAVSCESLETELGQRILRNFHVNDTETIETQMAFFNNQQYDKAPDINRSDGTFKKTYLWLPIPNNDVGNEQRKYSLLHRVIDNQATHWTLGKICPFVVADNYVYATNEFFRDYTVNGTSVYDFLTGDVAKDANVIFTFTIKFDENGKFVKQINMSSAQECIYDFKTKKVIKKAYLTNDKMYVWNEDKEEYDPYLRSAAGTEDCPYAYVESLGVDTNIIVSKSKLGSSFSIDEQTDSVKNCFYVTGGDDLMTNMVAGANINGSNYIYNFANFQTDDMSESLTTHLAEYKKKLEDAQEGYIGTGGVFLHPSKEKGYLPQYANLVRYENDPTKAFDPNTYIVYSDVRFRSDTDDTVYKLSNTAYYDKETQKVYDEQDNEVLASDYIYDDSIGKYLEYCYAVERYNWNKSGRFPDTTLDEAPGYQAVLDQIEDYFTTNNVIVTNGWSTSAFAHINSTIETTVGAIVDNRYTVEIINKLGKSDTHPEVKPPTIGEYTEEEPVEWIGTIRVFRETADQGMDEFHINVQRIKTNDVDTNTAYIQQKLNIAVAKCDFGNLKYETCGKTPDTPNLEKNLKDLFRKYNLASLKTFADGFNSCVTTLQDTKASVECQEIKVGTSSAIEEAIKLYSIRANMATEIYEERNKQVAKLEQYCKDCLEKVIEYQEENAIGTVLTADDLAEMQSYIREDEYNNSNYISDGLSTSALLENAQKLIEAASEELDKACIIQRKVSGTVQNIFAVEEQEKLWDKFALYNFIRCEIDDSIYKLRLLQIDFDEGSLDSISVTFSDEIFDTYGIGTDLNSIVEQVSTIATSYSATTRAAAQGQKAQGTFETIKQSGLDTANYVVKNSNDEEVTIDRSGINVQSMGDVGMYGKNQARLVGSGLYFTTDSWDHVKSALGLIKSPDGEWVYGLIADCIVGDLMVTKDLRVINDNSSVEINKSGIILDGGHLTWKDNKLPKDLQDALDKGQQGIDDAAKALTDAKSYADSLSSNYDAAGSASSVKTYVDGTYTTNITTAYQTYASTAVSNFDKAVAEYLQVPGATTIIGGNHVISPYIEGGYLNITNGDKQVIIDPSNQTKTNYIFAVKSGSDYTVGIKADGSAYFSGEINATSGNFTGRINSGSTITCGTKFAVTAEGKMTCTDGDFTGKITASSGTIGKWILNNGLTYGEIGKENSVYILPTKYNFPITIAEHQDRTWVFTIGSKFGILSDGRVYCEDVICSNPTNSRITTLTDGYITISDSKTHSYLYSSELCLFLNGAITTTISTSRIEYNGTFMTNATSTYCYKGLKVTGNLTVNSKYPICQENTSISGMNWSSYEGITALRFDVGASTIYVTLPTTKDKDQICRCYWA